MLNKNQLHKTSNQEERGSVAVIVAILFLFVLIPIGALAVDLAFLYVARNELQNAADAGSLAGARQLYTDDGETINAGANQIATSAITVNYSIGNVKVEVVSVERGHWSFGIGGNDRGFTANNSLIPIDLWKYTTQELDDPSFGHINAIKVVVSRDSTPVASFFSRTMGFSGLENIFKPKAVAVAYIGFAGSLNPQEVDQPFAVCNTAIMDGNGYTCQYGRAIHSGGAYAGETGAWTDFNQSTEKDICKGGASNTSIMNLYKDDYGKKCSSLNLNPIMFNMDIATTNAAGTNPLNELMDCFEEHLADNGYIPWNITIPVLDCVGLNNVTTCAKVIGAVNVDVVWVTGQGVGNITYPPEMKGVGLIDGWVAPSSETDENFPERKQDQDPYIWASFANHFNLVNSDPISEKAIYFLPSCEFHAPAGYSGGENFGILSKIPVLVN